MGDKYEKGKFLCRAIISQGEIKEEYCLLVWDYF